MKRALLVLAVLALAGAALGWWLTAPARIDLAALPDHSPDPERGAQVFWAAGCAACHSAPEAEGEARLVLAGGRAFASDFGTFYAPNISPDPQAGIGGWNEAEFLNAVMAGTSPEGRHYYPAFPYGAYALAEPGQIRDLWAYMQALPADPTPSRDHDVGFPFSIRRGLGLWKIAFLSDSWQLQGDLDADLLRGRALVESLGHCAECHTARNALGGLDRDRWLAGAPNPSGRGRIPNLTPAALRWSQAEIAAYLADGFTPEFDSAGGEMVEVIRNLANLPEADREAIAAYLAALPAIE